MNGGDHTLPTGATRRFTAKQIDAAIDRIAVQLTKRCAGQDPLLITVMLGALPFASALLLRLSFPLQVDYVQVSRYRGGEQGGRLEWLRKPLVPLKGRVVMLVDDVMDDGETLRALTAWCHEEGATEVISAVLVRKESLHRPGHITADFVGLEAGEEFLLGFGMDYGERYRNLPDIWMLPGRNVHE